MKECFKCKISKPLSDFYKHSKMSDGHLNKCKTCTKEDVRKHRAENDSVREYDRNRPNARERSLKNQERTKHLWETSHSFRESRLNGLRKWKCENPNKRKAQNAANNALRDGRLERKYSCQHCGEKSDRLHKHHWSYEPQYWLDVVWLCSTCHGVEHKRLNDLGRCPDAAQ